MKHKKIPTTLTNMVMIYDQDGNVLVEDRLNPTWPGITFPGGHVEADEPLVDAAVREVWEETGLKVSQLELCGIKDWLEADGSRYLVLLYKTQTFSGQVKSSREGNIFWTKLADLKQLKLASGMETMWEVFLSPKYSEHYLDTTNGRYDNLLK